MVVKDVGIHLIADIMWKILSYGYCIPVTPRHTARTDIIHLQLAFYPGQGRCGAGANPADNSNHGSTQDEQSSTGLTAENERECNIYSTGHSFGSPI